MCCNCSHSGQTCGSASLVVVVVVVSISPLVVLVAVVGSSLLLSSISSISSLIVIGVNSNEQARSIVSSFKICKASQYMIDDLVLVVAFPNVVVVLANDDDDCSTGITLCLIPEDDAMWNGFVLFVLFVVVVVVVIILE